MTEVMCEKKVVHVVPGCLQKMIDGEITKGLFSVFAIDTSCFMLHVL